MTDGRLAAVGAVLAVTGTALGAWSIWVAYKGLAGVATLLPWLLR